MGGQAVVLFIVGSLLVGFVSYFISRFVLPWRTTRGRLERALSVFNDAQTRVPAGGHVTDVSGIETALEFDTNLQHLWREFEDTLHAERSETEFDEQGRDRILRYRQTAPAEVYFSTRSLVDLPLKTDFFRHLPGILTGLGIIGTFGGLIFGLAEFQVSGSANDVNNSVESLVHTVRDAFIVSGLAILCSIAVTFVEKRLVTAHYGRVQSLQHAIDKMFDSGAGEDYLASIARKSDESATQLSHLREGLVNDLKQIFEDLADRQAQSTIAAAETVRDGIANTLQGPLETMQATMERSLEDQQTVVQKLMEGSLNAFAERLEQVVGEKLTGAAGHIETAAGTMAEAMAQVDGAVLRIRAVLEDVARSAEPLAANAERINVAADKLATTVEQSTETLDYAVAKFRQLGEEMATAMSSAGDIAQALKTGATEANAASNALAGTSERLESAQERLSEVASSLAEITDRNRREGASYDELIQSVERAANQLVAAQREVDGFLAGLSNALTEAHETFSREINGTLDRTHEAFHQNLAIATETLAGTVRSFDEFLSTEFQDSVSRLTDEFARLGNGSDRGNG